MISAFVIFNLDPLSAYRKLRKFLIKDLNAKTLAPGSHPWLIYATARVSPKILINFTSNKTPKCCNKIITYDQHVMQAISVTRSMKNIKFYLFGRSSDFHFLRPEN